SICKVGRDPNIALLVEGVEGLARLGAIADRLLLRQGGCTGCALSGTCGTCMPLAALYRKAEAPLNTYCQHRHPKAEHPCLSCPSRLDPPPTVQPPASTRSRTTRTRSNPRSSRTWTRSPRHTSAPAPPATTTRTDHPRNLTGVPHPHSGARHD